MPPINHERIRLLRQFHQLTQTELAQRVSVSQPSIADYEAGEKEPQLSVAEAMADTLWIDPEFLYTADEESFQEPEFNFRKAIAASERLKKKVAAQAGLFGIVVREIRKYVPTMPKLNVPQIAASTDEEVEGAAERARQYWHLGSDGPINSMVDVLESAGVVLTTADEDTAEKVDAFSRYGETSVVVLNTAKGSPSRTFFDTAHEAGHGVLHYRQPAKPLDVRESEAQRFASAFLMPRRPFARDFWARGSVDWRNLLEMKARWGTSLAAILVRARQLGLIDAATYRSAFVELSSRGWRTAEPDEPAPEQPKMLLAAIEQYEKRTKQPIAAFVAGCHVKPDLFAAVCGVSLSRGRGALVLSTRPRTERRARRR